MFKRVISVLLVFLCLNIAAASLSCARTPSTDAETSLLDEALNIVKQQYVDKNKVNSIKLIQGAVRGMLQALDDPYSSYLDPEGYKLQEKSIRGKYSGIGAEVTLKDGIVTVVTPIVDSPAEKAGMRSGDRILKIDGDSTNGLTLTEAVLKIRGQAGTVVNLEILHQDAKDPISLSITRAELQEKNVSMEIRDDVAIIRITKFAENTDDEVVKVLGDIPKDTTGIVLDLRNNPGGVLQTVVEIASLFLQDGLVLSQVDNNGEKIQYNVRRTNPLVKLPLVVLVNEGSASGSEVLAGAFQDQKRATIVGTKTFGKGSVNTFYPLSDGSAIYLTIARWFTPLGRPIEGIGLNPDIESTLKAGELLDWAVDYIKNKAKA